MKWLFKKKQEIKGQVDNDNNFMPKKGGWGMG